MTLEDLTEIILESFDFDDDHLYAFYYKDPFGNTIEINNPNEIDELQTTEIKIGEIPINV